jgi:hypothetical protein
MRCAWLLVELVGLVDQLDWDAAFRQHQAEQKT